MITLLLTFLGSSGFGSILGGIMGFLNRKVDLQQKALDLAHEKDKWAHELQHFIPGVPRLLVGCKSGEYRALFHLASLHLPSVLTLSVTGTAKNRHEPHSSGRADNIFFRLTEVVRCGDE